MNFFFNIPLSFNWYMLKESVNQNIELMIQSSAYLSGIPKLFNFEVHLMIPKPFGQAVDVGCGAGQSTVILAPYFQSVLGCDISKCQIQEAALARKTSNVEYRVAPAEKLPIADKSVHLLTAATCFHWLDKQAFFTEVDRVLAPGGVLAIYSTAAMYPITGNVEKDNQLRFLTNKFLFDDLNPYRSYRVHQVFEQYNNTEFPFDHVVRVQNISETNLGNAADAIGYVKSMSTFHNFRAENSLKADKLLQLYEESIMEVLKANTAPDLTPLRFKRDYFLIMCRNDKRSSEIQGN